MTAEGEKGIRTPAARREVTYGTLTQVLEETRRIYGTYEGLTFLLTKRQEVIRTLMEVAGDSIRGVLSTGYPNYQLPDVSLPDATTALTEQEFVPIAEMQGYLQAKLDLIREKDPNEKWPCLECGAAGGSSSLRSREHACASPMTPFGFFTAIPDLDLYIVVDTFEDASEIIKKYQAAGLNVAENQMQTAIQDFPHTLNIDPQFVLKQDLIDALKKIEAGSDDWRSIPLPLLLHHGGEERKHINHLGLDVAFSMIDHVISDPDLRDAFDRARRSFVARRGVDTIVEEIKGTKTSTTLPQRIGRLVSDHPELETRLRQRLTTHLSSPGA